ncbi:hypothetical protein MycrhDRAFT_2136 [Mycolicibacterium rhodesiae JS60]|nr:hypothetical protein MycrhDRAFT_2136 [Mycolicibacterium rhodesiae JS60]
MIAGFGDSGLLTAIKLGRHADIVGISAKPALLSGQELGRRLARPKDWARDNWVSFDKYRALDGVCTVQATLTGLDLKHHTVHGPLPRWRDRPPTTPPSRRPSRRRRRRSPCSAAGRAAVLPRRPR